MRPELSDLVRFAELEVEANDIEPWADILTHLYADEKLGQEEVLWATKLYNTYDDFGSAFRVFDRWQFPELWAADSQDSQAFVNALPLSQERRNLRGGKASKHLTSYIEALDGKSQFDWLWTGMPSMDQYENFDWLMTKLKTIWGVGRQTAFEWAEFCAKVIDLPVDTYDGALWESSGPRESLERLFGLWPDRSASPEDLTWMAEEAKRELELHGVKLSWWDFETVICDYNVMTKGRYYPGQHIAMIREEIEGLEGAYQEILMTAFMEVIPAPWNTVPAGASKDLRRAYRDLGVIITPVGGQR